MRDLDPLLNSLVNIDRKSLIAILSSEAEAAESPLLDSARLRSAPSGMKPNALPLGPIECTLLPAPNRAGHVRARHRTLQSLKQKTACAGPN